MKHISLIAVFALALTACPSLPPPDGCTPGLMRCHNSTPQVCSQTQRWTPADQPCSSVNAVCCATRSRLSDRTIYACIGNASAHERCLKQDAGTDGGSHD